MTRRGWIGATAAMASASMASAGSAQSAGGLAAASIPPAPESRFVIRSAGAGRDYGPALEALRAYARAELAAVGLPGMTLALTDADGFTAVMVLGWADVERRIPVAPAHYFQIGSISKSFIALSILVLADGGRIDLDAPVARYLPDAPLPSEPITVAQLMSHTSGLPDGAPLFPRTPEGRLWCGFAPGSRFSYSNTGYVLLGRVIERVTGLPHRRAVTALVRSRLGLAEMAGTITQVRRPQFAVGYWPWDRTAAAALPGARLEFASWDEEDTPAGSVGATGDQMALYLRALLRLGRGEGALILSEAAARRFAAPVMAADDFGPGAHYACGVALQPVDGAPCLHHTGGTMAFSSSFHADPAAGVACFASVNARNGGYRPRATSAYAIRLMRAVRGGAPLPAAPDPLAPYRVRTPGDFVGSFRSGDARLTLVEGADGLRAHTLAGVGRVAPGGADRLVTDHPALASHGLDAVRENGRVVAYWWGELLLGREGAPRRRPATPDALRALAGTYLNRDPWVGGARVLARGDSLWIDGVGRLVEHGGWWSAEKDPGGVERIRFDAMLGGQAQRLNVSGEDLWRLTA